MGYFFLYASKSFKIHILSVVRPEVSQIHNLRIGIIKAMPYGGFSDKQRLSFVSGLCLPAKCWCS